MDSTRTERLDESRETDRQGASPAAPLADFPERSVQRLVVLAHGILVDSRAREDAADLDPPRTPRQPADPQRLEIQAAAQRLDELLRDVQGDPRQILQTAAAHMRRELIQLCKQFPGSAEPAGDDRAGEDGDPQETPDTLHFAPVQTGDRVPGDGASGDGASGDRIRSTGAPPSPGGQHRDTAGRASGETGWWARFHQAIDDLPIEQRELFDLVYFHALPLSDVAEMMEIDTAEVKRRWRAARLELGNRLEGMPPAPRSGAERAGERCRK